MTKTQTVEMVDVFADLNLVVSVQVEAGKVAEYQEMINKAVAAVMVTMIACDGEVITPEIHDHSLRNVTIMDED